MNSLRIYQVDAFTDTLFSGNPAAVVPLSAWLPDARMQQIAAENNLSETGFYIPVENGFHIRWFTPTTEVDLCGHATLAAAHVMMRHEGFSGKEIVFQSKGGVLKVFQKGEELFLDFPCDDPSEKEITSEHISRIGKPLKKYFVKGCGMAVFETEEEVRNYKPDLAGIANLDENFLIITAPGKTVDFVSRCFGPKWGINEDPVTGSAHTRLIPYWAKTLGKNSMTAVQLSERGGKLSCELQGDRVYIGGKAVTYLVGEIFV